MAHCSTWVARTDCQWSRGRSHQINHAVRIPSFRNLSVDRGHAHALLNFPAEESRGLAFSNQALDDQPFVNLLMPNGVDANTARSGWHFALFPYLGWCGQARTSKRIPRVPGSLKVQKVAPSSSSGLEVARLELPPLDGVPSDVCGRFRPKLPGDTQQAKGDPPDPFLIFDSAGLSIGSIAGAGVPLASKLSLTLPELGLCARTRCTKESDGSSGYWCKQTSGYNSAWGHFISPSCPGSLCPLSHNAVPLLASAPPRDLKFHIMRCDSSQPLRRDSD